MKTHHKRQERKGAWPFALFIGIVATIIATPGFIYFYVFRELSVVESAVAGLVIGFFLASTFDLLFGGFWLGKKLHSKLIGRGSKDEP